MEIEQYCFEGEAKVICAKCSKVYNILFDGMNPETIQESIKKAMALDGWEVTMPICPNCYDPDTFQRDTNYDNTEELEETDYDDAYIEEEPWDDDFGGDDD